MSYKMTFKTFPLASHPVRWAPRVFPFEQYKLCNQPESEQKRSNRVHFLSPKAWGPAGRAAEEALTLSNNLTPRRLGTLSEETIIPLS